MKLHPANARCLPFEVLAKACGHEIVEKETIMRQASELVRGEDAAQFIGLEVYLETLRQVKDSPTKCIVCQVDGSTNLALVWATHMGHWIGKSNPIANASGLVISLCDDCYRKPDAEIVKSAEAYDEEVRRKRNL